ncbi:MAG: hypothetical protein KBD37_09645 [Burkholderiales bacterium]|nr:hypothetical protein [Burkholderiales bacterium]
MKLDKVILCLIGSLLLVSCGSSGSSGGGGSSSNDEHNSVPATYAPSINIGNITTIPTNTGSSGKSTVTITNNLKNKVILQSANYVLIKNGIVANEQSINSSGSMIDISQCSSIASGGDCSIGVNPPTDDPQGQYVINLKYSDSISGETYFATNVIAFSNSIPETNNGVRYSTQNNNVYNAPGDTTTLTVPFELTKSFASLIATSDNSNPAFAPTISCPGNNYTAGTLCNLYIKISHTGSSPLVTGNVTVNGTLLANSANKNSKSSVKNVTGTAAYVFSVPVTVIQNLTGNLVTSAVNVTVSPANGTAPRTITLLNNGTGTVSHIAVNGSSPLTISNNNCSTLAAESSCDFNVNVNSNTSGQSVVSVSYNNGASSGNTTGVLTFNVIYLAADSSPGLSLTSGQGNLNNVLINTSEYYDILVNNTGNVTLSNLRFTDPSTEDAFFSWAAGGSCGSVLLAGESCTLVLKYHPTALDSGVLNINATGTWTDAGGELSTYSAATLGLSYSSILGDAFLYITPNEASFSIRADGQDAVNQTFKVVNSGVQSTKLDVISLAPGVNGFSDLGSGSCTVGTILDVHESCTINMQYGNITADMSGVESQINIGYKPNNGYADDVFAFANLVFNSSSAAYVIVSDIAVTGYDSGDGTLLSPYIYTNTSIPGDELKIVVTYTNNGSADATGFNVALNNLPIGYAQSVTTQDCGTGATTTTLEIESSCSVSFYAVDPYGLYNPYNLSGTGLGFNIPGFSYVDANTGFNINNAPSWSSHYDSSNQIYVTTNLFATVIPSNPTWTTASESATNSYTFTSNTDGVVVTIPTSQLNGFTIGNGRTCTITNGSCNISITNPASFPLGPNYFNYYVTPAGVSSPNATNSIIQNAYFILN